MRIIPRQIKMVEASKKGEAVNQEWGKNAKNRSTHNTYFTLPVIFIMLSNHFPSTYGHDYNWLILILLSAAGAAIREYFVVRLSNPKRSKVMAVIGIVLILGVAKWSGMAQNYEEPADNEVEVVEVIEVEKEVAEAANEEVIQEIKIETKVDLQGVITFEGKVPKGKKLQLPAGCGAKGDVYSNEVIVNNGKLQNVFVRIIKGHENLAKTAIPKTAVELDQHGCIYTPRVVGVRAGQEVEFINSDKIFHNVRSITKENKSFNVPMPKKDQRITKVFKKPEIFLEAKCSVHPWMGAYIAVVDHSYFDVSSSDGTFTIKDLPLGSYELEAWHEVYGTQTQTINVTDAGMTPIQFTFKK